MFKQLKDMKIWGLVDRDDKLLTDELFSYTDLHPHWENDNRWEMRKKYGHWHDEKLIIGDNLEDMVKSLIQYVFELDEAIDGKVDKQYRD
jgi:hypothetical protein